MWQNPLVTVELVTLAEEILNGKLHFLCNDICVLLMDVFNGCSLVQLKKEIGY